MLLLVVQVRAMRLLSSVERLDQLETERTFAVILLANRFKWGEYLHSGLQPEISVGVHSVPIPTDTNVIV
jgi:hypothetical protein